MKIIRLTKYTPAIATRIRELLIQLSRSGKDKGEIPKEWFEDIINSPWHDLLLAIDEESGDTSVYPYGKIIGIATLSVIMGPGIKKNAYLEDFVTDNTVRGKGIGSALWQEMLAWSTEKGCANLEFTCGNGRETAQQFYKNHGASVYDTNFFRYIL
ncbi:GNAT family N-acetyltransferase [Candidatus Saccharibacteria bacterium]|nr:GNAT family N-acetyltransferase [Candidatus Saccharibacteria bacterium]